ncbi:pyridoxal-phosphate dependent enzyme [Rhodococcus sp. 2.95]
MAPASDLTASNQLHPPVWADIERASQVVRRHLPVTPLISHPTLGAGSCSQLFVKHENVHPTGAFKVRGGLNLVAGLDEATRARGLSATRPETMLNPWRMPRRVRACGV